MNKSSIIGIVFASVLVGLLGCSQTTVTPFPQSVRRIVVLPPYQPGVTENRDATSNALAGLPSRTIGDLLAQQARAQLAQKGFEVIEPSIVKLATKDAMPTSPQIAAQIARQGNLDAAVLYIEIQRWQSTPYDRGMKADGVIVALDATLMDPKTGAVLWQVHRPSRPVPVYGDMLTGQANVVVAETVTREIFASVASREAKS